MADVAYFWRLPPASVFSMTLAEFQYHELQAERIRQQQDEE